MIARALLLTILASPLAAQTEPFHAPCITALPDQTAYQNAFETRGWARAKSAADQERLAVVMSQIDYMMLMMPEPAENAAAFDKIAGEAAEHLERAPGEYIYFTRDGMMARLSYVVFGNERYVACLFAAPEIPQIAEVLATGGQLYNGILAVSIEPPPPPEGIIEIGLGAIRIDTPYMPEALQSGREALSITLSLQPAP